MEANNNRNMLMEMSDSFMEEGDRCGQVKSETGRMTPPEKPQAMKLEACRAAAQELDLDEVLPKKPLEDEDKAIDEADAKQLINGYASGAQICLAVVAFGKTGMPMSKSDFEKNRHFKKLAVRGDGLTYNSGLDPGYYYLMLPAEIQKDVAEGGCTFKVPYYENAAYPSTTERDFIKNSFRQAYLNLKALIDKVPQFEEAA